MSVFLTASANAHAQEIHGLFQDRHRHVVMKRGLRPTAHLIFEGDVVAVRRIGAELGDVNRPKARRRRRFAIAGMPGSRRFRREGAAVAALINL